MPDTNDVTGPVDSIHFTSDKYVVTQVHKRSKARHQEGIQVGDVIHYKMSIDGDSKKRGSGTGHYVIMYAVYVNDVFKAYASQQEVINMFTSRYVNRPAFCDLVPYVD